METCQKCKSKNVSIAQRGRMGGCIFQLGCEGVDCLYRTTTVNEWDYAHLHNHLEDVFPAASSDEIQLALAEGKKRWSYQEYTIAKVLDFAVSFLERPSVDMLEWIREHLRTAFPQASDGIIDSYDASLWSTSNGDSLIHYCVKWACRRLVYRAIIMPRDVRPTGQEMTVHWRRIERTYPNANYYNVDEIGNLLLDVMRD